MKIKQITNFLLKQYPLSLQEEWDKSGFLNKGDLNQNIYKIFVCLDLTNKVVDAAIKQKVKLIVSHHPILFDKEHPLLSKYKLLVNKVKKHKITVLSLHTCFDNSEIGMNFIIGEKLKLNNLKWYKGKQFVCGSLSKARTLKEIGQIFRHKFGVSLLTTNAKATDKYKSLAICAGSGLSVFTSQYDSLAKQKILLVTGDIKHHGWQELNEYHLKALDVGHNIENIFVEFVPFLINSKFKGLKYFLVSTRRKEKTL